MCLHNMSSINPNQISISITCFSRSVKDVKEWWNFCVGKVAFKKMNGNYCPKLLNFDFSSLYIFENILFSYLKNGNLLQIVSSWDGNTILCLLAILNVIEKLGWSSHKTCHDPFHCALVIALHNKCYAATAFLMIYYWCCDAGDNF